MRLSIRYAIVLCFGSAISGAVCSARAQTPPVDSGARVRVVVPRRYFEPNGGRREFEIRIGRLRGVGPDSIFLQDATSGIARWIAWKDVRHLDGSLGAPGNARSGFARELLFGGLGGGAVAVGLAELLARNETEGCLWMCRRDEKIHASALLGVTSGAILGGIIGYVRNAEHWRHLK